MAKGRLPSELCVLSRAEEMDKLLGLEGCLATRSQYHGTTEPSMPLLVPRARDEDAGQEVLEENDTPVLTPVPCSHNNTRRARISSENKGRTWS